MNEKVQQYAKTIQSLTLDFQMGKIDEKHYLIILSMCVDHIRKIIDKSSLDTQH